MRREAERLQDILDAIARIEQYAERGRQAFESDPLVQTWIVHHIGIIGEACRSLPKEFQDRFPKVPWRQIVGMRNIVVHHYFDIDVEAVWAVVQKDLPDLKRKIAAIREQLSEAR